MLMAERYAPCSGEGVGERFFGGGGGGEQGGVDGVGEGGGDDAESGWIVTHALLIVSGCGSGWVSSHIGKLGEGGDVLVSRFGMSGACDATAYCARIASVLAVSGMPEFIQWVTNVVTLETFLSWSVGWYCVM